MKSFFKSVGYSISAIVLSVCMWFVVGWTFHNPPPPPRPALIIPVQIIITCEGIDDTDRMSDGLGIHSDQILRAEVRGNCVIKGPVHMQENYQISFRDAQLSTPLRAPATNPNSSPWVKLIPRTSSLPQTPVDQ